MLVTAENLVFSYPDAGKRALDSVSLSVSGGEYVTVLGANGSGKSTLARCLAGLLVPDSGSVRIQSPAGSDFPAGTVPSALVFQSPGDQIVAETVELDTAFGPENIGLERAEIGRRVRQSLGNFSLSSLSDAPTRSLTLGQKQRLALAGVHALAPAVLLLDEPTSMLSALARDSFLDFLDRWHAEGGTIIHITHDLSEARRSGRVVVLDDGHLVFDGIPANLDALPREQLVSWGLAGADIPARKRAGGEIASPVTLECTDLSFGPVQGLAISAHAGDIIAVTGESGSGKTVLLEIIAGLRAPESGTVRFGEGVTATLAVQESEASLFAEFVADDVAFGPRNAGLAGASLVSRVSSAMDLAGLPFAEFSERRTFSLSGGERRKAALAGIIAMDAPVVLLDEPSSALDTRSRAQLLTLVRALADSGNTVIFTTNRVEECAIADSVIALGVPGDSPGAPGASPVELKSPRALRAEGKRKLSRDQRTLESLRKGASGPYRKLDTPVHRLPPLAKYVLVASCAAAALAVPTPLMLCAVIALELVPLAFAKYPFGKLGVGILRVLPWLAFFGAIQYLFTRDPLQPLGFVLHFIALYLPLTLFMYVTGHTEIVCGMEDVLAPLRILRAPVRDISLVTGIVFRFMSLLYEEATRITTARIVRGSGRKRGLVAAVTSTASLFVPLVIRTLTRADLLAQAITARYYGTGEKTRYMHWQFGKGQIIVCIALPLLALAMIIFSRM